MEKLARKNGKIFLWIILFENRKLVLSFFALWSFFEQIILAATVVLWNLNSTVALILKSKISNFNVSLTL